VAEPFATVADLSARGVAVTNQALAEAMLADASETLRGEIGWQVYPAAEITVVHRRGWRRDLEVHLPGSPIRGVTQVAINGFVVDPDRWELVDNTLIFGVWRPQPHWHLQRPETSIVEITYTVGWDAPPAELTAWTCVLAAQWLDQAARGMPLGAAPATLAVDDFKVQFSAQQQAGELPIPERVLERLRARYGTSAFVTGA